MSSGDLKKKVFISYSRKDKISGMNLHANLIAQNIDAQIDETSLQAGDSLNDSIGSIISNSDFVICLISESSLRSPWVIWEIQHLLGQEKTAQMLPAALDQNFLDDNITDLIRTQLTEIISRFDQQISLAVAQQNSFSDFSEQREKLLKAKNNLPEFIEYLRSVNVINLESNNFEHGFLKLYEKISGTQELIQELIPFEQVRNTDYSARRNNIFDLILEDEIVEAAKKSMDLVKEFFPQDAMLMRKIGILCARVRRLENEYQDMKQRNSEQFSALFNHYSQNKEISIEELYDLIPYEVCYAA